MKTFFFYLFFIPGAFILQGCLRYLPLPFLHVDLVWLMIVFLGFEKPAFPWGLWVFLLGLTSEALGASRHGTVVTSYLMIYFFLRIARTRLFFDGTAARFFWVILLTFVRQIIERGLLLWQGYDFHVEGFLMIGEALLEGLVGLWFFPFLWNVTTSSYEDRSARFFISRSHER